MLTFRVLYDITRVSHHGQLEGHLINFITAMNRYVWSGWLGLQIRAILTARRLHRLEDISHEAGARRGLGLGQGYGTQIRVTDQRARIVADAIVSLPSRT